MPPQQTDVTFETGRDAAGLRRDVAMTFVRDPANDGLEAASLNASLAALDGASSRQDATGQTAASPRASHFLTRWWRAFQAHRQRQRLRASLHDLSDRELMDIGMTRGEIDYIASDRGIDPRGDCTTLWVTSRGVS